MYYHISHTIAYTYDRPVVLKPHLVRLRPRSDGWQRLCNFAMEVNPQPKGSSPIIDLDGNAIVKLWFEGETESLRVTTTAQVETCQTNPFDYRLEPWAIALPLDYPGSLRLQLAPYLQSYSPVPDPAVVELAQDIYQKVNGNPNSFLGKLNQHLYKVCKSIVRETGDPWLPGVTLRAKRGSCQDLAVLFVEVCRAMGLAARFVSGYEEGDGDPEKRELHAWAEVYLPGGGWRGYDPSQGLAVADSYVALTASALPQYTAPIAGDFTVANWEQGRGRIVQPPMEFQITLRVENGVSD